MQSLGRAAGRALPVVAGAAAAAAAAPTSAALADAHSAPHEGAAVRRLDDAWELADIGPAKAVYFAPAEIDDAVALLTRKPGPSALVEELDSAEASSDGSVDGVIEAASWGCSSALSDTGLGSLDFSLDELCTVAGRLLKSPGVQQEVVAAALQDPEVFGILASKVDLPAYLQQNGFAASGLLEGGSSSAAAGAAQPAGAAAGEAAPNLLALAASGVENLGHGICRLGRWLRAQLAGEASDSASATAAAGGSSSGEADEPANTRRTRGVIGAVLVVCVAIVATILLRRPGIAVRVARRA